MEERIVYQHLDKVMQNSIFRNSKRSVSFLDYICRKALVGDKDQIKEYSIGIDAFGLDFTFNPQNDPRVRVEARRLRQKLDEYYRTDGRKDPLRIVIPKGSYIPEFQVKEVYSSETEDRIFSIGERNLIFRMPRLKHQQPLDIKQYVVCLIQNSLFLCQFLNYEPALTRDSLLELLFLEQSEKISVTLTDNTCEREIPLISYSPEDLQTFHKSLDQALTELSGIPLLPRGGWFE